jgi:hypothetical protein
MDSDYEYDYSSAEDSYGVMASEDGDFEFDTHAEVETVAKKVSTILHSIDTTQPCGSVACQ